MSKLSFMRLAAAGLIAASLGACTDQYGRPVQAEPNVRNAAIGAAAGAVAAKAFDGDATKGALGGAALGALACPAGIANCAPR